MDRIVYNYEDAWKALLNNSVIFVKSTIIDYKVINNKVVIVTFSDGTTEKAVCDDNDKFDLEVAIQVCMLKKILGRNKYYNIMKSASKQIKAVDKIKAIQNEEKEMIARQKHKNEQRKLKRKEAIRQARIDEMSEAFNKAMRKYDIESLNSNYEQFVKEYDELNNSKDDWDDLK